MSWSVVECVEECGGNRGMRRGEEGGVSAVIKGDVVIMKCCVGGRYVVVVVAADAAATVLRNG